MSILQMSKCQVSGIAFHRARNSSKPFIYSLERGVKKLPEHIVELLIVNDSEVFAPRRVVELFPKLKYESPEKWIEGSTWENARGCRMDTKIVVAEEYLSRKTGFYVKTKNIHGVLRHETGHRLYDITIDNNEGLEEIFEQKVKRDLDNFTQEEKDYFDYYLRSNEAFSEVTAALLGGGCEEGKSIDFLLEKFTNVRKFVGEMLNI